MTSAATCLYFIIPVVVVFILETIITYRNIRKFWAVNPISWIPPGWIFGIVWVILFTLMAWGGSLYYIDEENSDHQINFLSVFYVSLLLNFLWVVVFFTQPGQNSSRFALMILLFLLLTVIYMAVAAWNTSMLAAWFFIAYGIWLVFAGVLNIAFIIGLEKTSF